MPQAGWRGTCLLRRRAAPVATAGCGGCAAHVRQWRLRCDHTTNEPRMSHGLDTVPRPARNGHSPRHAGPQQRRMARSIVPHPISRSAFPTLTTHHYNTHWTRTQKGDRNWKRAKDTGRLAPKIGSRAAGCAETGLVAEWWRDRVEFVASSWYGRTSPGCVDCV